MSIADKDLMAPLRASMAEAKSARVGVAVPEPDPRGEYVAGLRALADILEREPELPLPHASGGIVNPVTFEWSALSSSDPASEMARIRRLIRAGQWGKNDPAEHHLDAKYYKLVAHLHGVDLQITAFREQVCTRVITGTREVTKMVPAPDAPMVEVTETVEDVEWVCEPLLAEVSA